MPYQDKVGQTAGGEFGSVFQAPSGGEVVPNIGSVLTQAAAFAGAAAASAAAAETAETNAETAETNAELAETNAEAAAAAAAVSAAAALVSENNAETAETNAELAETNAETAQAAAEAARDAAIAARNAAQLAETNAETAETNAELAETNAEAAQAAAEAALDDFTDLYLGTKAADPALDNDGDALVVGALYYNSVSLIMKIYNGATWDNVASAGIGVSSITGTANQITASAPSGAVTLSLSSTMVAPGSLVVTTDFQVNGTSNLGNGATDIVNIAGSVFRGSTGAFTIATPTAGTALTINAAAANIALILNAPAANTPFQAFQLNGTAEAYIGVAGAASGLVNDAAVGDLIVRVEGGAFRVSTDSGTSTSFAVSAGGIVQTRSVLQVGGLDSGVGKVSISTAGASNTGYIEFLNEGATRQSYIGFQTDGGNLIYTSETGGGHEFNGASVLANTYYQATTPGYNTGITGVTNLSGRYTIPTNTVVNGFSLTTHSSMYTILSGVGYIQHLAWGSIRSSANSYTGGFFIGISVGDTNCTEYYAFQNGGALSHTSGALSTTNAFTFGGGNHVNISGAGCGVYYSSSGTYLLDNNSYSSYGPHVQYGSKTGYAGFYQNFTGITVCMYDSNGSGGNYREASGLWQTYWDQSNLCLGIAGSTTSSSYEIYVNGALYATGDIVAFSDARYKENLVKIDSALDKVGTLSGYTYDWIESKKKAHDRRQAGLIAQEVQKVLPEAVVVDEDNNGDLGLNYNAVIALLVNAVNELREEVRELKRSK
jgi:hypothetical protein